MLSYLLLTVLATVPATSPVANDPVVASLVFPELARTQAALDQVHLGVLANLVFPLAVRASVVPIGGQAMVRQLVWDKSRDAPKAAVVAGPSEVCGPLDSGTIANACIDVRALFRAIAQGDHAVTYSSLVERVGLDSLEAARATFRLEPDGALATDVLLSFASSPQGLLGALGPAIALPDFLAGAAQVGVEAFAVASVRPETLYFALAKLVSYQAPIEYSLWKLQLSELEHRLGGSLSHDALGDDPQVLGLAIFQTGQAISAVSVGVHDAKLLAHILSAYLELMRPTHPQLTVSTATRGTRIYTSVQGLGGKSLSALLLAFDGNRAVVAMTRQAADELLTMMMTRPVPGPTATPISAVASGFVNHGHEVSALRNLRSAFRVEGVPNELRLRIGTRQAR